MPKQLVYGRHAIAEAADTSLPVVDAAIADGDLETFLVGRKRKATEAAVRKWVKYLKAESDAGRPLNYRSDAALKARRERLLRGDAP